MAIPNPEPRDWQIANAKELQVTDREVLALLRAAKKRVDQILADLPTGKQEIRRAQLENSRMRLLAEQADLFERLGDVVGARRARSASRAARLSAAADNALLSLVGKGAQGQYLYDSALEVSQKAIDVALARMRLSSTPLSQRIYRTGVWMGGRLGKLINETLASGLNAAEFAKRARDWFNPNTPGGVRYAAMRLARTEINNAFHAISAEKYATTPWINQVEWNLSKSHPKPDICNVVEDLSPYPADSVPARPHPQCMCYITPKSVEEDEFIDSFLDGEYDDYLDGELAKNGWDVPEPQKPVTPVPTPEPEPENRIPVRATSPLDKVVDLLRQEQDFNRDKEVARALAERMEFTDPKSGITIKQSGFDSSSLQFKGRRSIEIVFHFIDAEGNRVGTSDRSFYFDGDDLIVDHEYIRLHRTVRGAGLASRWNAQNEAIYREMGAKEIRLTANIDVGGYAWAKAGYGFLNANEAKKVGGLLQKQMGDLPESLRDEAQSLIARASGNGKIPLPLEFAMLGWSEGLQTWPGKEFMMGIEWKGRKVL